MFRVKIEVGSVGMSEKESERVGWMTQLFQLFQRAGKQLGQVGMSVEAGRRCVRTLFSKDCIRSLCFTFLF